MFIHIAADVNEDCSAGQGSVYPAGDSFSHFAHILSFIIPQVIFDVDKHTRSPSRSGY
jgi:hypothetical protein